jgi:hypothetical protein
MAHKYSIKKCIANADQAQRDQLLTLTATRLTMTGELADRELAWKTEKRESQNDIDRIDAQLMSLMDVVESGQTGFVFEVEVAK